MTDFLRFIDWANRPFEELRVHFNPAVIETITMPCIYYIDNWVLWNMEGNSK